ncbi:Os07g0215350 [Oryza sativa Japonica Group]|uniref:Os07g0215350 protein n=1 Tax=Oryza sativa subsp. japonica TaxID=39947 RepID=A0A0P0X478_ORYSJ|nr:Os07g0215350 [Oryza sativa Japonica Group]
MDAWLVGLSLACCRRWVLHACTAVVPFIPPCLCLCSSCAARLPIWAMAAGRAAALPEQMPQPQLWKPGGRALLTSPCPPARRAPQQPPSADGDWGWGLAEVGGDGQMTQMGKFGSHLH